MLNCRVLNATLLKVILAPFTFMLNSMLLHNVNLSHLSGERFEYRMLIGKVYREIVQSPQNWMKRSTCTRGIFVDKTLSYPSLTYMLNSMPFTAVILHIYLNNNKEDIYWFNYLEMCRIPTIFLIIETIIEKNYCKSQPFMTRVRFIRYCWESNMPLH